MLLGATYVVVPVQCFCGTGRRGEHPLTLLLMGSSSPDLLVPGTDRLKDSKLLPEETTTLHVVRVKQARKRKATRQMDLLTLHCCVPCQLTAKQPSATLIWYARVGVHARARCVYL